MSTTTTLEKMAFFVPQKELWNGINKVQKAVAAKSTLPILQGIYLETVKDKGLLLRATDLEISIEYWINVDVTGEGKVVLPAKQFFSIVKELPNQEIEFSCDGENLNTTIKCAKSHFKIKGYDPEEFPSFPEIEDPQEIKLSGYVLRNMINDVIFAKSTDQSQPGLTGVHITLQKESIEMAATNTYKLAYSKYKENITIEDKEIIIPGEALIELNKLTKEEDEIQILVSDSYIKFEFNDIIFISRLIEDKFPKYKNVLPKTYNTRFKVQRTVLLNAVKRVSLIAKLEANNIIFKVNEEGLIVEADSTTSGVAKEFIEVDFEGEEQIIYFDANYMLDALKALSEDVLVIEIIDNMNPLIVKKESDMDNYLYLVMPVRPTN